MHTDYCMPMIQELVVEAGESRVWGQPGLLGETRNEG